MTSMIDVRVNVKNPGQFFACCGLFELAHRVSEGCRSTFTPDGRFRIIPLHGATAVGIEDVMTALRDVTFEVISPDDLAATPLHLSAPFNLRLDWWTDDRSRGAELKTWAGQQKVTRIAEAMQATLIEDIVAGETLFESNGVLYEAGSRKKKVEPFYFDSRRAAQAHAIDIGFSPDTQGMEMPVHSTVELLCLVGLQRFRPRVNDDRSRTYRVWTTPMPIVAAAAIASCGAEVPNASDYRFRLLYRTKYLKGFLPSLPEGDFHERKD
jgi:CRISPR-associated protein Csb3